VRVAAPLFKGVKMDTQNLMEKTQVAAMFHVAPRTISDWVQKGSFPAPLRNGKKPLWIPAIVEAHLQTLEQNKPVIQKPEARSRGVRAAQNSAELQTMQTAMRAKQMQTHPRGKYPKS
jgi:hypothetical protein